MRPIDADALKARIIMDAPDFMDGGSSITKAFILAMIGTRSVCPTIDAVSVVRCKDCKNRPDPHKTELNGEWHGWCERLRRWVTDDWFCAYGEGGEA